MKSFKTDTELHSLGLNRRQRQIVVDDVTQRLESLLSHWSDLPFRRTVLLLGSEEASFWEPQSASLDIRALVVVAVRNSLVTDLNASQAYTRELRSRQQLLPDERMPWLTAEAIKYFQAVNLDAVQLEPRRDLFGFAAPLSQRLARPVPSGSVTSEGDRLRIARGGSRADGFVGWPTAHPEALGHRERD